MSNGWSRFSVFVQKGDPGYPQSHGPFSPTAFPHSPASPFAPMKSMKQSSGPRSARILTGIGLASLIGAVSVLPVAAPASATHDAPILECASGVPGSVGVWTERTCSVGGEITAAYRIGLGRDPDGGGFYTYISAGPSWTQPRERIRNAHRQIHGSQEGWNAAGGSPRRFVELLFGSALNRWPDAGGLNTYVNQIYSGRPHWQIAIDITASPEYNYRLTRILERQHPYGWDWLQTYNEADYFIGGDRPYRVEMHWRHFVSWKSFRQRGDDFDTVAWSDNGCSTPLSVPIPYVDQRPCLRHDFGWRNFKTHISLEATTARKAEIDAQFLADLVNSCDTKYSWYDPQRGWCSDWAYSSWLVVRAAS